MYSSLLRRHYTERNYRALDSPHTSRLYLGIRVIPRNTAGEHMRKMQRIAVCSSNVETGQWQRRAWQLKSREGEDPLRSRHSLPIGVRSGELEHKCPTPIVIPIIQPEIAPKKTTRANVLRFSLRLCTKSWRDES